MLHFTHLHCYRADDYFRGEIEQGDAEAEAPILWPPDAKSRLIGKDPDAGKDGRQKEEEKEEVAEDEMVR